MDGTAFFVGLEEKSNSCLVLFDRLNECMGLVANVVPVEGDETFRAGHDGERKVGSEAGFTDVHADA